MKQALLIVSLALTPLSARAQTQPAYKVIPIAPGSQVIAFARGGELLSGFPAWWYDSIVAGVAKWVTPQPSALPRALPPGASGEFALQLRRSGDLYRVRVIDSIGVPAVDSAIVAGAWLADEVLAFPGFPPQVDGAGAEVRFVVTTPLRDPRSTTNGVTLIGRDYEIPPLSPACDSALVEPNAVQQSFIWLRVDSATGGARGPGWARTFLSTLTETVPRLEPIRPAVRPRAFLQQFTAAFRTAAWYHFEVDANGRVVAASINTSSGYPALDSAILTAVHRADSQGMIPPPPTMGGVPTAVELGLELGVNERAGGIRLAPIGIRYWTLETAPTVKRIGGAPVYPRRLRADGIGGRVTIEFVVGDDGVPVPESMRVIGAPHPDLVPPSLQVIAATRFNPGTVLGCPIPVVVRQAVNYNAGGPRPIVPRDVMTPRPF